MKRSNSKKSPANASKDFANSFYNKFAHPGGIGLYGPGKIKINKEKQSVSSRGSARWKNQGQTSHGARVSKQKAVSIRLKLYNLFIFLKHRVKTPNLKP